MSQISIDTRKNWGQLKDLNIFISKFLKGKGTSLSKMFGLTAYACAFSV